MICEDVTLNLRPHDLERMSDGGTNHSRNNACDEVINPKGLSLLIQRIVESCKGALLVAGSQSALEEASKSLKLVDLHSIFYETSAPSFMTRVLISSFEDGERVRGNSAHNPSAERTGKGDEHRILDGRELLIKLLTVAQHGKVDGAAEASPQHVGCYPTVKGSHFAIVVKVPKGNRNVLQEIWGEDCVLRGDHQHHFDVLKGLQ